MAPWETRAPDPRSSGDPTRVPSPRLEAFAQFAAEHGGPPADAPYDELWRWSVTDLDAFWLAVWRFFDVPSDTPPTTALAAEGMPGSVWFPEVRTNYAETMLRMPGRARRRRRGGRALPEPRRGDPDRRAAARPGRAGSAPAWSGPASGRATGSRRTAEHARDAGAAAGHCQPGRGVQLLRAGVRHPERHRPLAADRADGARRGRRLPVRRKDVDRAGEVAAIRAALPSVETTVWLPYLDPAAAAPEGATGGRWTTLGGARRRAGPAGVRPGALRAPAVHPLLLGHHRPAEADRARPRRDHRRAPQGARGCTPTSARRTGSSGSPRPAG